MKETDFKTKYEKDEKVLEIIRQGVLNLQVCTNLNQAEIERVVNDLYPCGTTVGWVLSKRKEVTPVKCKKKEGFIHYIMDC